MTYTTPAEKKAALCTMIDNLTACAIDRSAQSFQMFLEYRTQLFEMIEKYQEEDEDKIKFLQEVHSALMSRYAHFL